MKNKRGLLGVLIIGLLALSWGCSGKGGAGDAGEEADTLDLPPASVLLAVDILVVIDNSGSMAEEQQRFLDAFPALVRNFVDPPVEAETGQRAHEPVRSLHLGVVSTDMGVGGYDIPTCGRDPLKGDDGILQSTPRGAGCGASYPRFLSYEVAAGADPDLAAAEKAILDFACIAALGTDGCEWEQPLEAAHEALMSHSLPGGVNEGFLRNDSILVVLFLTDEDDCSITETSIFNPEEWRYPVQLLCYLHPYTLYPVDRYVEAFSALRPAGEGLVLGLITGVPPGDPDPWYKCNGTGDEIDGCFNYDAMNEVVRPDGRALEYSCTYPAECTPPDPPEAGDCATTAFPAKRFVQVAMQLGASAFVESLCSDDYSHAIDSIYGMIRESVREQVP
ncbi:MAG: hypothetical protein ABIJ56_10445 [Pseudomonadota bacterium]